MRKQIFHKGIVNLIIHYRKTTKNDIENRVKPHAYSVFLRIKNRSRFIHSVDQFLIFDCHLNAIMNIHSRVCC